MSRTRLAGSGLVVVLALLLVAPASARTITVGPGGPPTYNYATIQGAIDDAGDGDVIVVAKGTYAEAIDFGGKAITVCSTDPTSLSIRQQTIIDGLIDGIRADHVVNFGNYETSTSVIAGFTITNGHHGVRCYRTSSVVRDCIITSNTGGGVVGNGDSAPTVERCNINLNSDAGVIFENTGILRDCVIVNNSAQYGGGVRCDAGTITGNVIQGNVASSCGGGVYCGGKAVISNNLIIQNSAGNDGAGIYCFASANIWNNTICANTLPADSDCQGGGIYLDGASPVIRNCIIAFNKGSGVYIDWGTPLISYCNFYANEGGNYGGESITLGAGCLTVDPLFVRVDPVNPDYHLKSRGGHWTSSGWIVDTVTSPCIDAGDPLSLYANEPAPNGGRINMGAFGNTVQASKTPAPIPLTLSWVGTEGFVDDGVAPDSGVSGTLFTYKVKYTGPTPDFVRLRLYYDGVEVGASPLTMTPVGGTPATGQIFMVKKALSGTRPYSYCFEARSGGMWATGAPTQQKAGPAVSTPPMLAWAGTSGFVDDGVTPDSGAPGTLFTYKVKYTGPTPDFVRLRLYYNGVEVGASPLTMTPVGGTPATGQIFMIKKALSGTRPYAYRFEARSGGMWATGAPTQQKPGPAVPCPPTLSWANTNGFVGDGVAPDSGAPGTLFTYKVKYTGPTPDFVRLRLYYNGVEVGVSPLTMTPVGGTPATGQIFMVKKALSCTRPYAYRFEARSGGVWATGAPTGRQNGPVVTTTSAMTVAMVSGLACVPASSGTRLVFTLSADMAVTVEVTNIAGRPIRTIVTDRQMPAGVNELYWDGRSSQGLMVPNGTYLIRLTSRAENGAQAQAVTTLQITR